MFFLIVSLANVLTQYLDLKDDKGLKLISDLLWFIFSNILQVLKDNFWHYFYQIDYLFFKHYLHNCSGKYFVLYSQQCLEFGNSRNIQFDQ